MIPEKQRKVKGKPVLFLEELEKIGNRSGRG